MTVRNRWLIGIPLAVLLVLGGIILALPEFVSSAAHRATIEALASSLTGRDVHIGGKLSLAILPAPQLIAEHISINGPDGETITARAATLDIAVPALLEGRISASSITLQSPAIVIPWPPPRAGQVRQAWLASLHGQIKNGRISIGALQFSHVNADLFTSAGGAVSLSGSLVIAGRALDLSFSIGGADAVGGMPVAADVKTDDAANLQAHLAGTLNSAGELNASLTGGGMLPGAGQPAMLSARVAATSNGIGASDVRVRQGSAGLTGSATLVFAPEALTATLSGENVDLAQLRPWLGIGASMPATLDLTLTNSSLAKLGIPALHVVAAAQTGGVMFRAMDATLASGTRLTGTGQIDNAGGITGKVGFDSTDLPGLLTAYAGAVPLPADWRQAQLTANLLGNADQLSVTQLHGAIGAGQLSGGAVFTDAAGQMGGIGQLHFDRIDLTPLLQSRGAPALSANISLEGEITADRARIGQVQLTHVLMDAVLGRQLTIRRLSASLYGGVAAASFAAAPGQAMAAHILLSLPSAAPLFGLLPPGRQPPRGLAQAPLALSVLGRGPAANFATSGVAILGALTVTAAPVLDLPDLRAAGPLTLRYPSAITALRSFGMAAGLAWPGAGSAALRADFTASATQFSLPDFIMSFGALTANGTLAIDDKQQISADIDADTLALPALPLAVPWQPMSGLTGGVKLSANQVVLDSQPILGRSTASVTFAPDLMTITIPHAQLANGDLSLVLTAATAPDAPPQLAATVSLTGADATAIRLPFAFPITLPAGRLDAQAKLTATGYTPAVWTATLAGPATLAASDGTLNGFGLAAAAQALGTGHSQTLRAALIGGATNYATISLSGSFQHGSFTIANAALQGQDGGATATGSIDIPDRAVALSFTLSPAVTPPIALNLSTIGNWQSPRQIPALGEAQNWKPSS